MKITQNHPRFNDIKNEADRRLSRDFTFVDLEVAEKAADDALYEHIQRPSFATLASEWLGDLSDKDERAVYEEYLEERLPEPDGEELAEAALEAADYTIEPPIGDEDAVYLIQHPEDAECLNIGRYEDEDSAKTALGEMLLAKWRDVRLAFVDAVMVDLAVLDAVDDSDSTGYISEENFYEWLEESRQYSSDIEDHYSESEHYPLWSTLFEAKDSLLARKIMENVDALYDLGIGVIEEFDNFNPMLFVSSGGHDFYEAYWIPMYALFGWIDPTQYPDPAAKLTGCNHCGRPEFTYLVLMVVEVKPREWAPLEDRGGVYLTEPQVYNHQPTKILRCTYCGTEHSVSNFNWTDK